MASALDFITTNPFNKAFDAAQDQATDQAAKDAQRALNEARLAEITAGAPIRVRTDNAQLQKANADATVAVETVDPRIAQERNKAGYTEGQMVGQQQKNQQEATMFPEKMREQTNQANYAGAQYGTELQRGATEGQRTRKAGADADVAVGTVQPRIGKSYQEFTNAGLTGDLTAAKITGQNQTNQTNYQIAPFKVQAAADVAAKADVNVDTAENQRTTAANNAKITAAKLEQQVFKIGATEGAGAARVFAQQNGVDISPEALANLGDARYMETMKGIMANLEKRMPGDANILARDAVLDKVSPLVIQSISKGTPIDQNAIEQIISPVTPNIPATKAGGGGKIWTMPDVMREARQTATARAKGEFGGVDQPLYDKVYNDTIEAFRPFIGQPVTSAPAPAAPAPVAPGAGQIQGLLEPGNIDLKNRPVINNPDGTISTEQSISFNEGGQEILIPTVVNGQKLSGQQAIDHYHQTGEHLGKFATPQDADAYAISLHNQQDQRYSAPGTAAPMTNDLTAPPGVAAPIATTGPAPEAVPIPNSTAIATPQVPPQLQKLQLQWSASKQQFRDKNTGQIYDVNGMLVQ